MNRREMLSAMGATVAVGCGIEYVPDSRPLLIKIKTPRVLTLDQRRAIHREWKSLAKGPLADIPVVVLEGGTDIEIVAERNEDVESD